MNAPDIEPAPAAVELSAEPGTILWGRLPCESDSPVLTVRPGDAVTIHTVSHEGLLPGQGSDPIAFFGSYGFEPDEVLPEAVRIVRESTRSSDDGPHVVVGPIAIRGAEVGDVLTMTLLSAHPRVPYGVVSNRHGKGALAGELPLGGAERSVLADLLGPDRATLRVEAGRAPVFPIDPFLGIMGVAVAGSVRPHSVPPGPHGGNLDIRLLTAGSRLHLPVLVPGALAYVGDPHFAQGDGEVALTAVEGSLTATVRFDLVPAAETARRFGALGGPLVETDDYWAPVGLDEDLDLAVRHCVRAAIDLLAAQYGLDEASAYAYLSAATDFDISQVVDGVKGAHARIRKADFA
ncbi:acetamidase/formamidase family protein [Leifsonia sp. AG29]|uniref:acetamidase/formamidase family protein n=1 Tax=Leifsonia sp. AG29 TaxID=2598860 RepID=UPI00131CBFF6|nr:acetamidase/formamidase family protein [Leifsonia sp. AG29]